LHGKEKIKMKEAIQMNRKVVLTLVVIIVFWFAGQGKAQSNIGPLLVDDIAISTDQCRGEKADIAFDGQRYLVVWAQSSDLSSDIYGRFITTTGSLDGGPFLIANDVGVQHQPAVAFNGTYYMVVYYDNNSYNYYAIRGQRVGVNGDQIGSNIPISLHPSVDSPDVASDGTNFLVIWDDKANYHTTYGDIAGQLISSDGTLISTNFKISGPGYQTHASVEFGSNGYLVVWMNRPEPDGEGDIYGALIDTQGTVSGPIAISTAPGGQGNPPGISFDDTTGNYLVVWNDYRDSPINKIYGTRVSETGSLLDGPSDIGGIPISNSGYSSPAGPQVAFDGTDWLVVWMAGRLKGSRVSTDGNVLDPSGIYLNNIQNSWSPRIAFDGINYMVTWYINDSYYSEYAQLIGPVNVPPTVLDDVFSTNEDQVLDVSDPGVLENDFDNDGDGITAVLVTSTYHGSLTLNPNGSFIYYPGANFNGMDEFVYKANDGDLDSEFAVATISVNMVNDPPVAKADGPILAIVGDPVKLDASASSDTEGAPLSFSWDFGDGTTLQTTDAIAEHTYLSTGIFDVTLVVDDGELDSDPFYTTATIGASSGGGRNDVNSFLYYVNPVENRTDLLTGTSSFEMTIIYGATIDTSSFEAILNKDLFLGFNPAANTTEKVEIPLNPGRNVLVLKVNGIRSDGRTATDRDRLTFIVP
jgi:PKD domain/Bacterial Ig domain